MTVHEDLSGLDRQILVRALLGILHVERSQIQLPYHISCPADPISEFSEMGRPDANFSDDLSDELSDQFAVT